MNKLLNKKYLMPTVVLLIICLVSTVILAALNIITKPMIEAKEREKVAESLRIVMPGGEFGDPEELGADAPESVVAVYRDVNGKGHVVTLLTQGYNGEIAITVGVDAEGKIIKAVVTKQSESHGKAGMENYTDRFTGCDAEGVEAAELFSGATISSTIIKDTVKDAMKVLGYADGGEEPEDNLRADADILDIIGDYASGVAYEKTDLVGENTVKKVFKSSNNGYAVYVVTSTQYVAVETEAIVFIDADGKITDLALLTWTVGHGVDYTQDYVNGFNGKDSDTIGGIDLVAGATGTAEHLRDAVAEALEVVSEPGLTDSEIKSIADEMLPGADLEKMNPENKPATVKKLFRDRKSGGYIAYIITSTQYVAVETEGIVAIDAAGKITDVKLLTWTVGHGVDYTEAYLDSFIGKTQKTLTEVELVTEATGTSTNFRDAVNAAMELIQPKSQLPRVLAIILLSASVIGFVAVLVVRRKYR